MINKFTLYRFIAPFRSRLQSRLRAERTCVDAEVFRQELGLANRHGDIGHSLWQILREQAYVRDFRPAPNDDLGKVYAMGPEEVRDDVIETLVNQLGLSVDGIDLSGFDYSSVKTARDVCDFVLMIANHNDDSR